MPELTPIHLHSTAHMLKTCIHPMGDRRHPMVIPPTPTRDQMLETRATHRWMGMAVDLLHMATTHPMAAIYTDLQQAMELPHMLAEVELRALERIVVRDCLFASWLGVLFVVAAKPHSPIRILIHFFSQITKQALGSLGRTHLRITGPDRMDDLPKRNGMGNIPDHQRGPRRLSTEDSKQQLRGYPSIFSALASIIQLQQIHC